ncbi:MAG: carbohydrate kinase family protein [Spirochaetales bacterium]|jgi:pseudouridine kinase
MIHREKIGRKVVIVGGANIDLQGISFSAFVPGDSNPGRIFSASGGVGRNIAENCARLGLATSLITAFGDDADAVFLRQDCVAKGIDVGDSLVASKPTARYLCALDANGRLMAAVADMAIMELLTPLFLESRKPLLDQADFIVADANLPAPSLAWLAGRYGRTARLAENRELPLLFLDTVSTAKTRRAVGLSGEFDCIKPNGAEAAILAGVPESEPAKLRESLAAAGALPAELYISLGEKGIYYYTDAAGEGSIRLPAPELRPAVLNRSGAGDAACAALLWATAKGFGAKDKARCALTAAMLAAASAEPVSPDLSEASFEARMRSIYPKE